MIPVFPIQLQYQTLFFNYFSSIANKTKLNISFSHKDFFDYLKNRSNVSFFLSPTDEKEIMKAISLLDSKKSVEANSFPAKVLKLLKNEISSQLPDIFNNFFFFWCFSLNTKKLRILSLYIRRIPSLISQINVQSHFFLLKKNLEN